MSRGTALIFSTSVIGLAFLATTGEAQQPLRIGASLSQTGSFAALGQNQLRGYQLCVKHANEKGGVLGRKIELLVEDDQSKAPTAVAIYEKLITQDKVDAILGPFGSPITEAVASVNEKNRMPMVAHAATTSIFKKGRKFIFMVLPPAEATWRAHRHRRQERAEDVALINEDTLFPKARPRGRSSWPGREGSRWSSPRRTPKGRRTSPHPRQGEGREPRRPGRRDLLRGRGGAHAPSQGAEPQPEDVRRHGRR